MEITLPREYGFAVIDVVLYSFLLLWMGRQVSKARKKYNVPLPAAYENKADSVFNRYQRAHQNSVEGSSYFFVTLCLSAIATPILSGIAGLVFIVGRYLYCKGYYQSPEGRKRGRMYSMFLTGYLTKNAKLIARSET